MKAKLLMGLLLVLSVILCGCSPQKSLAHRLKGADHIVITYNQDALGTTIAGEEVAKVIQAIASAKKESPFITASPYLQFQFYKGTEHLETITTSGRVLWIEHKPYSDPSGMLDSLTHRYREEHPPRI